MWFLLSFFWNARKTCQKLSSVIIDQVMEKGRKKFFFDFSKSCLAQNWPGRIHVIAFISYLSRSEKLSNEIRMHVASKLIEIRSKKSKNIFWFFDIFHLSQERLGRCKLWPYYIEYDLKLVNMAEIDIFRRRTKNFKNRKK